MNRHLVIIDGSSYIFRAYFALPSLTNSKKIPTNATYGFLKMLKSTLKMLNPTHISIALDSREPSFRKKKYTEYKANREKMPDDLAAQIPYIQKLIDSFNIRSFAIPGYEADDIIGTLVHKAKSEGYKVTIVSGDKDLMQLVDKETFMLDTMKNKTYNEKEVELKLGVPPSQIIDLLAIMGDSSDNIPGVKGIGQKGATELVREYGTLENIYTHIDNIKDRHKKALSEYRNDAFLSKELVTIDMKVPVKLNEKELELTEPDYKKLTELFRELEFFSELKEIDVHTNHKNRTDGSATKKLEHENIRIIDNMTIEVGEILIGHDLKSRFSYAEFVKYKNIFDTKLAAYELSPGKRDYPLDELLQKYGLGQNTGNIFALKGKLEADLKTDRLETIYNDIDLPCIKILKKIEETGALVDRQRLKDLDQEFSETINYKTEKIFSAAGTDFNVNSPKQVGNILFDKLGLPIIKKTETGYSTDQEVLEELSKHHPIVPLITEYRELSKLRNTYVLPLLDLAARGDGRIHTIYHIDVTATGRLSSSEPNLQNIPIRSKYGEKIRETFIAPKGSMLVSADYSQIELRILAALSKDKNMLESFQKGEDIHTSTASQIFDVDPAFVTSEQRRNAKAINFGLLYGKTPFGLAKELNITVNIASKIINRYFEKYNGIAKYIETLVVMAKEKGFTETIHGRRRYLPDINSKNKALRSFAERNAVNAPIQGTAADIIKLATIALYNRLKKEKSEAKIILHVHDEIVLEVKKDEVEKISKILKHEMENAFTMDVPLTVDLGVGNNWLIKS